MVFSSLVFLCIFFPVVFCLHAAIPSTQVRNALLTVASLFFYAFGEPVYVTLMVASAFSIICAHCWQTPWEVGKRRQCWLRQ